MINKEAIEKLGYIKNQYHTLLNFDDYDEVFDIAIKALEERPHGKWIPTRSWDNRDIWVCSKCGNQNRYGITVEKACWCCGADMRGKEKKNDT
jgi:rubrerythrin